MQQRVGLVRALQSTVDPADGRTISPRSDAQTREILQEELLQLMQRPEEPRPWCSSPIRSTNDLLGDRIAVMSARPGRIREMIDVPSSDPATSRSCAPIRALAELRAHIWHQLHTARPQKAARRRPHDVQADKDHHAGQAGADRARVHNVGWRRRRRPVHAQHRHPRGLADLRARLWEVLGARVDQSLFTKPSKIAVAGVQMIWTANCGITWHLSLWCGDRLTLAPLSAFWSVSY